MKPKGHAADQNKIVVIDEHRPTKPPTDPSRPKIGEAKAPPLDPEVEKYLASEEPEGKVR
jgi:hypothetical protein